MNSISFLKTNTFFLILSAIVAHLVPFELMLFSYAFLGPGHYLTEISWLHDKSYFSNRRSIGLILLVVAAAGLFLFNENLNLFIFLCVALSIGFSFRSELVASLSIAATSWLIMFFLYLLNPEATNLYFVFLLPTIIHVFIFSFLFIISGYLKRKNSDDLRTIILYPLMGLSFFLLPDCSQLILPSFVEGNLDPFLQISDQIKIATGLNGIGSNYFMKFVSFAYTFHYLNWYSKTKIIGWGKVSKSRRNWIVGLTGWFICIYIIDYKTGMAALSLLSFMHVILELPLNVFTVKSLFSVSRTKKH